MQDYDREDLLRLTPALYLADGYLDSAGQPRPELRGIDATAAATQLMAAGLAPQELGFTRAAIELLLPEHDEPDPQARLHAVIEEALSVVARAIQQTNNEGLVQWLSACLAPVQNEAEIAAFTAHLEAANRQYAVLVSLLPPDVPSVSPSASP